MSQGMWVTSEAWKSKETDSSLAPPEEDSFAKP